MMTSRATRRASIATTIPQAHLAETYLTIRRIISSNTFHDNAPFNNDQSIKLIFINHLQSTDPSNVINQSNHQNHSVTLVTIRGKWVAYLVTIEMSSIIGGQKKKGIELDLTMMDADKSYPIEQDYVAPIAPPILPPHQAKEMEENACKSTNWSCLVVTNARPSSDGGRVFQYHTNLCSSSVQRYINDVILPLPNCISLLIKLYSESTFYLF
jgi:hypothetical protein